jgi:hypothetical protein
MNNKSIVVNKRTLLYTKDLQDINVPFIHAKETKTKSKSGFMHGKGKGIRESLFLINI